MATCKYCGNYVADEMYEQNNGMCDLCIRTAQGEDDLIITPKRKDKLLNEPTFELTKEQIRDARLRNEEKWRKDFGFEIDKYENKSFNQYTFPNFIKYEVIDYNAEQALLIMPEKSDEKPSIFWIVVDGLKYFFFALLGLVPVPFIFMIIFSGEKGTGPALAFLMAFFLFWSIGAYVRLGRKFFRHFKKDGWVLITNDHFECCHGRHFDSKKAKKYYFDNVDIFYREDYKKFYVRNSYGIRSRKKPNRCYVRIMPQGIGGPVVKQTFDLEVANGRVGRFVEAFLKWYVQSKGVGGFGSGRQS